MAVRNLTRQPLLLEAHDHAVKNLHIFDMDGTLMLSPEPKWGSEWYRYHTRSHTAPRGRNWNQDHEGWWSNPKSLEGPDHAPFPLRGIVPTLKAYHAAKAGPDSKVIVMTGRVNRPEMQDAVSRALRKIGVEGHKHGKDLFLKPPITGDPDTDKTDAWKRQMIRRFAAEHPNLRHVSMWDDRRDHLASFQRQLQHLGINHKLMHVRDPEWGSDDMPSTT